MTEDIYTFYDLEHLYFSKENINREEEPELYENICKLIDEREKLEGRDWHCQICGSKESKREKVFVERSSGNFYMISLTCQNCLSVSFYRLSPALSSPYGVRAFKSL